MGVCVETLKAACSVTLEEVASTICKEMKEAAMNGKNGRYVTGTAAAAVQITSTGEFSKFVGGIGNSEGVKHLYWLDEGNGKGRIYPKRKKALWISDHNCFAMSVKTYEGIHFVHTIAARHGGG